MPEVTLEDTIERKALTDGQFAIAYALLTIGERLGDINQSLRKLGVADASTSFGAIEILSQAVDRIAESLGSGPAVRGDSVADERK